MTLTRAYKSPCSAMLVVMAKHAYSYRRDATGLARAIKKQ